MDVRPYLPDRETARALSTGSAALLARGWHWVTEADWRTALNRLGSVALGAAVVVQLARTYTAFVMPVGMVGWIGAALAFSRPSPPPPAPQEFDEHQDRELAEDQELAEPEPELADVAELVRHVAGQQQGAHLDDLVATTALGTWDKAELKAALGGWGVPVSEFKLRFDGRQRVRLGVRVRDLPAALGEGPQHPAPGLASAAASAAPLSLAKTGCEGLPEPSPPPPPGPAPGAGVGR